MFDLTHEHKDYIQHGGHSYVIEEVFRREDKALERGETLVNDPLKSHKDFTVVEADGDWVLYVR